MDHINPFTAPGRWFKGSLHIHTTASDGDRTPEQVVDWYRGRGYHFIALTDHNRLSEGRRLADDFITLPGIEVDGIDRQSGLYHVVGLGLHTAPNLADRAELSMQQAVDRLRAAGGVVHLAHPYWSGQMSKDLLDLEGCFGLEVYNGGCEVDDAKGPSVVHWDDLLAVGRRPWGLAVDDAHWRHGDRDAGLGWVWVKAEALTEQAILAALERGCFYASSGPELHDVRLDAEQNRVTVSCSPAVAVDFVGNGPFTRRIWGEAGALLTEASYQPRSRQRYVRVACLDGFGHYAWSNPFFFAR